MPASPPNKAASPVETGIPAPVDSQSPLIGFRLLLAVTLFMLLSLAEMIPVLGVVRPTLLLTLVLIGVSIANFSRIKHRLANPAAKSVTGLALYVLFTFPLAYW